MQIEIQHGPANAAAKVSLALGESVSAEAGAMIAMSGDVQIETTTLKKGQGGILKAMKRVLAGESFFLNHFTAQNQPGEVWLAPVLPGDLHVEKVTNGHSLIVRGGAYLAGEAGINLDMNWQGFKSIFSGESVFWLKTSGEGQVVLSAFGAIYPIDFDGEYVVDAGHVVAFPEGMKFRVTKAGKSWLASILGGEGLVLKFKGQGRIWCQSHNPQGFGALFGRMLKMREN